ncbi:MAG TPA: carboxypeptidase regulatory-like domain-containing protein [Pyrinomonadaceae bacterium]|nr:carboxypeptidase regulatory-like domain-containing protein [Pyrinomonadaceae bacterium]
MLAPITLAQEFRATLTGNITDPQGAVVVGAKITVKNLQTGDETSATSSDEGSYTIPSLLPGRYNVTVEAQGFKKQVSENVELHTADKATIDVALEIGGVDQVVTVNESDTPLLESDTATRGQVIENRRITELPLNGRNPIMLATLAPGVQFNGNPQFTRPFDNGDNAQFSINGGVQRHNEFLLDGAPNNAVTDADTARTRSSNNIAYIPPVDATQEFKVQTNSYDASYGRTGGGVINVTTKAGGNDFHGTAYEFLRRYQLEANTFENNAAGRPRFARDPVTGENLGGRILDQYGGNFSGPINLPRFGEGGPSTFNGRDNAFFFVAYERYRERLPAPRVVSVPTLLERQGDFSQSGITIYDPLTTRVDPNDPTRFTRDPFPGNIIPANRLNPVGLAVANGFPSPNTGAAGARFNNFINSPNLENEKFYNFVLRGDGNIGQNEHIFVRYVRNRRDQFSGADYPGLGLDAQDPLVRANNGLAIDSVTTISPTVILNLRATYTRFVQAAFRTRSSPFDATSIGFPESFDDARPVSIVPRFEAEQYSAFGPRNPSQNTTNTVSLQGNVSLIRGTQFFKVGGEVRDNRINARGASFSWGGGQFAFSRAFTQQDPQRSNATQGSSIASLLLGYPSGGLTENLSRPGFRWRYHAVYLQDDWKVSPRLSLNLGLRYDYEAAPTERFNQQNRGFGFDQTSPLAAQIAGRPGVTECPACANLRGGLLFTGVGGEPEQAFDADRNNIQPRVGVAYQLDDKTVLRGGYGLYYFPQAEFGGTTGYTVSTGFVASTGGGAQAFIPANTLSNPFPTGLIQPTGSSLGLLTQVGNSITFSLPSRRIPTIHQFSFGGQRQLPYDFKLDVAYVGSRSRDILTNDFNVGNARNINVLSAAQLAEARANPTFYNASVPNPFAGLLPGTNLNGGTVQRRQLLLPYPQFGSVTQALENVGEVWYNSLQASIEKRMTNGLTMIVSYTYSRTIGALGFLNNQDAEPSRSPTDFDRPHVAVVSGVYRLPFGRGQRFASDAGKALDLLLGGWEYNFIGRFQSGIPLAYPGNVDLLADPRLEDKTYDLYFNTCVQQLNGTSRQPNAARNGFEPCTNPAWAIRGPDTLRTIPFRTSRIREHTAPQLDMSFNKSLNFSERYRAQFRAEAFNVTNTPLFGGPNTDPNSTNFGFVTRGNRNFPRQIQFGFKFYF